MKFGSIEVIEQPELTSMPQEAASAWFAVMNEICGATYKPVLYVGGQPVKGVNHVFIAEQTFVIAKPERHIAIVTINEFDGKYNVVSIERII